jgi:lipopolysaccharide export system permease protein
MPRLWIYLIKKFFSTFAITLSGIISFLIVIRFSSIAGFSTSGSGILLILKFISLIIPYVLPYAIPISCLNAAIFVSRKLSQEKQITALRASGFSIWQIFSPIFVCLVFISGMNFFITGSLAPKSKVLSKSLIYDTTLKHPLFITQKACPIKIKSLYTDVGRMQSGDSAEDLLLVFKNKSKNRLSLIIADKLSVKEGVLKGKNLAFISSMQGVNTGMQDDLMIENENYMKTGAEVVDVLLNKDDAVDGTDYMDFFYLLKNLGKKKHFLSEVFRRLYMTISPAILGFLGLCFGLNISRLQSIKSVFIAVLLATLFIVTLVTSRSFRSDAFTCLLFYSITHLIILSGSLIKLYTIQKGKA